MQIVCSDNEISAQNAEFSLAGRLFAFWVRQSLKDYLWPHKSKLCHWNLRFIGTLGSFGPKNTVRLRIKLGFV